MLYHKSITACALYITDKSHSFKVARMKSRVETIFRIYAAGWREIVVRCQSFLVMRL
jgi:hypothetical protein